MISIREHLIRGGFSFLAAAVTLAMSQEWVTWALEQHRYWKLAPATVLACFSVYEAHSVWRRGERVFGLTHE